MRHLQRTLAVLAITNVCIPLLADLPDEYGDSVTGTAEKPAVRLPKPRTLKTKRYPEHVLDNFITKAGENPKINYEFHLLTMKDGAQLATHVTLPVQGEGPWPVVFMRGPYGALNYTALFGPGSANNGWVYVSQDMRGRWHSPGSDAVVFLNDGWGKNRDAHETLDWIAAQNWCNGKVVTWGGSALAVTQVLMAPGAPRVLKAQFISQSFSDYYLHCVYQGGCFREVLIKGWLDDNLFDPESLNAFVEHSTYDEFWDPGNALAQAHRVNAPAVFAGAWYDIFSQSTLESFIRVHNSGGPGARGKCRLVMSPGGHASLARDLFPKVKSKEIKSAQFPVFLDHYGMDRDNGVAEERAVHYFVMGDSKDPKAPGSFWRHQDNWPPSARHRKFYLHPEGVLKADIPPDKPGSRTYTYDPNKPVPTIGGNNMRIAAGPLDQRPVETRPDILLFTTDALDEPMEITGHLYARLFVSSDCPDTDFAVKVCDVHPDGASILITDGILKARFREGFTREVLMEPGATCEILVDLWSTSYIFNRGHRIRVSITSSNWPRFTPNPNNGSRFRLNDPDKRVAQNTVHFSGKYPSHVILPVYAGPTDEDPKEPWGERLLPSERSKK
ncbi:MAG: CocE/NonD family hydrolase [Planctomycetota bacterium]|jgi:predicted acyl esterase